MSSAFIMIGLFLIVAMQVAIFAIALKKSPGKAALCLVIPLFVYVYAKNESRAKPFLWAWYGGIAHCLLHNSSSIPGLNEG